MPLKPNGVEGYVKTDGTLSIDGLKLLQDMEARIASLEAKSTTIAAVTPPTGGSTIDAEAMTAINEIISGAG